ncbi:hypothetical protein ACHAXR_008792, partial [Thalassiosira sp. AJA248-18]
HERDLTKSTSVPQQSKNIGYNLHTQATHALQNLVNTRPHVRFAANAKICTLHSANKAIMLTYESGADVNYMSMGDRQRARLPILRKSTKRVGVANGYISLGNKVTKLPIPHLEHADTEADTFDDFPDSPMSVGKTSDAGTIASPFSLKMALRYTRKRTYTHHMQRNANGNHANLLQQANSVYDLPTTEQAIKQMHAVCGYPVKSTWLSAVKAGNYVGWPLMTARTIKKYYPETTESPKGHLNQTHKNVRSTKQKPAPFEVCDTTRLRGKKERVYDVRETIYSDQTGQFPTRSLSGNKYIMVMVDIDSSGILVEPIKSHKDAEMIRAYQVLMLRLKRANIVIVPKKHVLDNEVSDAMKELIRSQYQLELVPPRCHRRNAAKVAIRNFKVHFLSILAGVANDFPMQLWDQILPQAEITVPHPTVSAYAHNKMPLAPMGCNVQVHEKNDKHGTWAFHSVNGWYLATSPEHYRTHKCHIKDTKSDCFSDTVQFQHKNPSHTPQRCNHLRGVDDTNNMPNNMRITRSMAITDTPTETAPVLRVVPTTAQLPIKPKAVVKRRRRIVSPPIHVPPTALARNTRSRARAAAQLNAPPAHNTRAARARQSLIPKPSMRRFTHQINRIKN